MRLVGQLVVHSIVTEALCGFTTNHTVSPIGTEGFYCIQSFATHTVIV